MVNFLATVLVLAYARLGEEPADETIDPRRLLTWMTTRTTTTAKRPESVPPLAQTRRSSTCACARAGCAIIARATSAPSLARRFRENSPLADARIGRRTRRASVWI